MALILKQEANANVTTPPSGSGAVFLNSSDQLTIKDTAGNISTIPTFTATGNTSLFFNDAGAFGQSANLTFVKTTNVLTVTGNVAATRVLTDNLLYANGTAWDLSDPGGSNTQIQFNDQESFGGSAAFTFNNSSNLVTVAANLNANNLNATTHITSGNVWANSGIIGALTLKGEGGNISNIQGGNVSGAVGSATTAGTVTTAAQPNITSVGTLTSLGVNGNITAANITANTGVFTGNGSGLSAIAGANVSGAVGSATTAGTVTTAAQPNITSVGTLSSLSVTGNVTGGNLNTVGNVNASIMVDGGTGIYLAAGPAGYINFFTTGGDKATITDSGNIAASNLVANSTVFAVTANISGNVNAGNVYANSGTVGASLLTGTLTTAAQPNITSVGTLTTLTVTGTTTAGNISTGGTLSVTGNANVGNLGTAQVLATANVTAPQLISNVATGTAPLAVTSTTQVANLNAATAGTAGSATTAGTVTTAAQPNITSVGTLTGLGVNGNITAANITANTGVFTGNGSGLSAIAGANVTGTVANATFATSAGTAGTVTTAAQPNITSVGTLTGLGVNGTITGVNITANTGVFTGNGNGLSSIVGANVTGAVAFAATANAVAGANVSGEVSFAATANAVAGANVSGQVANALVTGTVYTAAQPNITSVGTLTSVSVTGNVAAGNLTTTGVLSVTGTGVSSIAGNLDMTSNTIINLAQPTNDQDAATKKYVDDVAQGLNIHDSCQAATPNTLAIVTGGTITYNNGASGVGANLTTTGTFNLIDGVNVQTAGTRILVKNEANTVHNGIYTWSNATVITRATDFNSVPEVEAGDFTFVTGGTLYDNTGWVQTASPASIGGATDFIEFTQFSGAGTYTAGTGLTLTDGTVFNVNASQTQVTAVGTLIGLNSSGTITAPAFTANTGVFTGNGAALTNLNASNVSSGTLAQARLANSNVILGNTTLELGTTTTTIAGLSSVTSTTFVGALTGAATTAGTVTTAAQPNITSVGTLTSLGVSGTVTAPAFTANTGIFTGNGSGLSAIAGANVTGTVANATFATSAGTAGTVTTAAQPNITSVGTLTSLGVNGTVTAVAFTANTGVFTGNGAALTNLNASNVSSGTLDQARLANASVTLGSTALTLGSTVTTVAGLSSVTSTTFVGALTGAATTAGTVTTAAQPNITSVGTLTSLAVTGNVTAGNVYANSGTIGASLLAGTLTTAAQPNITSVGTITSGTWNSLFTGGLNANTLANIQGANVSGTVSSATTAGTVTTAAQPNITSVGTLTSLTSSGNISGANVVSSAYSIVSVGTGISGNSTAQSTGTVLSKEFNVVSTANYLNNAVVLPVAVAGMRITVINTSGSDIQVFPAANGRINSAAANVAYSHLNGSRLDYLATSTTQWYTLNATYG